MRHNPWMHALFPFVVYGGIALFVIVGVLSMLGRSNNLYDQIGQGGLTLGDDLASGHRGIRAGSAPRVPGRRSSRRSVAPSASREIRQMLQARSDRRVRSGEAPLDIDAELAALEQAQRPLPLGAAGPPDSGLALEVRQLVLARNERRRRQGQPPLDVDAEVQRTLAELGA